MIAKRSPGFSTLPVYARQEPHSLHYLSERVTFWVALLSVFAFVTGNMFGQHGWHVFWASVLGESAESTIVFAGTVPPVRAIPDYERWAKLGGNVRDHTYREVPQDYLIPLPKYEDLASNPKLQRTYFVDNLGTYDHGIGEGSHTGMDIAVPIGTPIQAVANGIITKVGNDPYGFGNYVVLKMPRVPDPSNPGKTTNLYAVYAHLSAVAVEEKDIVKKGDDLGATGMTGFATGPHLHFQMDREEAPWHPYWPFTGQEARDAGFTTSQAVNAGLHRERGLQYTVNPMLFVQAYQSGAPVQVARASSSRPSVSRLSSIEQRRQDRLSKLGVISVTTVTLASPPPAPVEVPEAVSSSSAQASSSEAVSSAAVRASATTNVASVAFFHDGAFGPDRAWHSVELRLLDADGNIVTLPVFDRAIVLRTAYGKAEFKPESLTAKDFINGKATVQVLPLSNSTIVMQAMPLGSLSEPYRYQRDVATR